MKAVVLASSFNPKTGKPNNNPREEIINTKTNRLFKDCKTLTDVAETYMHFWNRFPTRQSEIVLVQSVTKFALQKEFESYDQVGINGKLVNMCFKIENGYRIEKKFTTCGKEYCFIKDAWNIIAKEEDWNDRLKSYEDEA